MCIRDRHDIDEDEIVEISNGKYIVDAKIELEEFVNHFQLKIDPMTIDAETLGGFFIAKFGVLPKLGDKIQVGNINIKVTDTDNRRIKKFKITLN